MKTKLLLAGFLVVFSGSSFADKGVKAGGDVDNGGGGGVPASDQEEIKKFYMTQTKNNGPWQKERAKRLAEIAEDCGGHAYMTTTFEVVEVEGTHRAEMHGVEEREGWVSYGTDHSAKYLVLEKCRCGFSRGGVDSTINSLLLSKESSAYYEWDGRISDEVPNEPKERSLVFKVIGQELQHLYKKPYEVDSDSGSTVLDEDRAPAASSTSVPKTAPSTKAVKKKPFKLFRSKH